jgi:pseudouridine kinase
VRAHAPFLVCVGGAAVDRAYRAPAALVPGTSNPVAAAPPGFGGVARNVAENLARLEVRTALVSVVGDDENGRALEAHLASLGIVSRIAVLSDRRTAEYVAVLQPSGEMAFGLADMEIFGAFTAGLLDEAWPLLAEADWVFADCNLPAAALQHLITRKRRAPVFRLAVDAVSTPKAKRLPADLTGIDCLFVNRDEAVSLLDAGGSAGVAHAELAGLVLDRGCRRLVMTLGGAGVLAAEPASAPAVLPTVGEAAVDVTGAGDALIAGTLSRLALGTALAEAVGTGLVAAALTIERHGSVRSDLSPGLIEAARRRIEDAATTKRPDV